MEAHIKKHIEDAARKWQAVNLGVALFEEVAQFGYQLASEENARLKERVDGLKEALKEFDTDENWMIESSYIDRPIKTVGSDWVYIGQWDPRIFSTKAIEGKPLPNTKLHERKNLSDFYKPNPYATQKFLSMEEKIQSLQSENARLKEMIDVAVKALEKCCAPEPDGFGSYVAEEFETNDVLEGRKILTKIRDGMGEK
jgi:hypothetical protein